jgi:hypothetical protein
MSHIHNRLRILESKARPESDNSLQGEYAKDKVSLATRVKAAMLAMELGITIEALTGHEG